MKSLLTSVFILVSALLPAQTVLTTTDASSSGHGTNALVRDSLGHLYSLSIVQDASGTRMLVLYTSTDNGATWADTGFTFHDAATGLTSSNQRTTICAMTIDDQDRLHATWGAYVSGYNQQYYRSYEPSTATASAIVDINAVTGASTFTRGTPAEIRVDANNVVWMVAHGTSSWRDKLVHSDAPYAAGGTFTDVGFISSSASAQNARMAIDANGDVHCTYYRNLSPGQHWHRTYTPGSGWNPSTVVGNGNTAPHDYLSALSADSLGNVHAIIAIDSGTPATTWKFRYKKWDLANGWSAEVPVFEATNAEYSGVANYRIFDIACDATTGRVYAIYRDLAAGGMLRLATKGLTDTGFTVLQDITTPTLGQHEYYLPGIRDTLYPASNHLNGQLDITYQNRFQPGVPPYSWVYHGVPLVTGPTLTLSASPAIGTNITADMLSPPDAGDAFVCGFSFGNSPGITLPDSRVVPLNFDALYLLTFTPGNGLFTNTQGTLDGSGAASTGIAIPNAPGAVGATFYCGAVALNPSAPSNVSTVFPSLSITLVP